jgi:hypothetical protein
MLLKIFARVVENSREACARERFLNESLGSPGDARIRRRLGPTVESPVAVFDGRCACFFNFLTEACDGEEEKSQESC